MKKQLLFLFLLSCYSLNAQQTIVEIQNNNLKCAINSRGLEIGFDNGVFLNYLNENGDELGLMASASLLVAAVITSAGVSVGVVIYLCLKNMVAEVLTALVSFIQTLQHQ